MDNELFFKMATKLEKFAWMVGRFEGLLEHWRKSRPSEEDFQKELNNITNFWMELHENIEGAKNDNNTSR